MSYEKKIRLFLKIFRMLKGFVIILISQKLITRQQKNIWNYKYDPQKFAQNFEQFFYVLRIEQGFIIILMW